MIPVLIIRIGVYECAQRSAIYNKPWDERSELLWCEEIHFEHTDWVWSYWLLVDFVDSELWDCTPQDQRSATWREGG